MTISFTKMQALGNDFVVINANRRDLMLTVAEIKQMADRHLGIGFDQLLWIDQVNAEQTSVNFRVFNADGSEVGQCANGARCVARFCVDQPLVAQTRFALTTQAIKMTVEVIADQVSLWVDDIKPMVTADPKTALSPIKLLNQDYVVSLVDVGNPHAILLVDSLAAMDLTALGEVIQSHFDQGINFSVVKLLADDTIEMQIYERGVGQTDSCGSAALAAVYAGQRLDHLIDAVTVYQPGGGLLVAKQGESLVLTGEVGYVFSGQY